jgi:hypothetical protein
MKKGLKNGKNAKMTTIQPIARREMGMFFSRNFLVMFQRLK